MKFIFLTAALTLGSALSSELTHQQIYDASFGSKDHDMIYEHGSKIDAVTILAAMS